MVSDNIDYAKLAQELLKDKAFVRGFFHFASQNIDFNTGELKAQTQDFVDSLRRAKEAEIRANYEVWYSKHIEGRVKERVEQLSNEAERIFEREGGRLFQETMRQVVRELISTKFANKSFSFTIGDLLGDDYE